MASEGKWKRGIFKKDGVVHYTYDDRGTGRRLHVIKYKQWEHDEHKETPYEWAVEDPKLAPNRIVVLGWSDTANGAKQSAHKHANDSKPHYPDEDYYDDYCPEGYEWVRPYTKEDGTYVKGHCAKRRK